MTNLDQLRERTKQAMTELYSVTATLYPSHRTSTMYDNALAEVDTYNEADCQATLEIVGYMMIGYTIAAIAKASTRHLN